MSSNQIKSAEIINLKYTILNLFIIGAAAVQISFADVRRITVSPDGNGDFISITAALQSLPMFNYQRTEIFIKEGTYVEKFRIDQDYITLTGESKEKTVIKYNQPRESWIKEKDSIGPAVVNIFGDDIILKNLTIENTQPEINTHAFAVYGTGTRTIIVNCSILSRGGDTVALWDYKNGMYYHSNCSFKGSVDFVCPRGWCYIKNSEFYQLKQTASIWHAGGYDIKQKLVIENSSFDGVKDFQLGRHHYEAQFFLIDCKFSDNMSDKPIYRVTYTDSALNRPFNWGKRYYFYNCVKDGRMFGWLRNNLNKDEAEKISASWTFDGKWDPESELGPRLMKFERNDKYLLLFFDEIITVTGIPVFKSESGISFIYHSGGGSNAIRFTAVKYSQNKSFKKSKIENGRLTGTTASIIERDAVINFNNH